MPNAWARELRNAMLARQRAEGGGDGDGGQSRSQRVSAGRIVCLAAWGAVAVGAGVRCCRASCIVPLFGLVLFEWLGLGLRNVAGAMQEPPRSPTVAGAALGSRLRM